MKFVYILVEEREASVSCRICGVWKKRENACEEMLQNIRDNHLFTKESKVSLDLGIEESDTDYCQEEYCNYSILKYEVQ